MSSSPETRALNALTACFVADAACMGTHWIYKEEDLANVLGEHADMPEFHEPPACPFYNSTDNEGHYNPGDMSCYGEEAHALLLYMTNEKDVELKSGKNYARALHKWVKTFTGRKNHCTKLFEGNMDRFVKEENSKIFPACGVDPDPQPYHDQANSIWRVPAVVCRYIHDPKECLAKVETAVRVDQNSDVGVAYALSFTRMLLAVLNGKSVVEAIEKGKKSAPSYVIAAIEFACLHAEMEPDISVGIKEDDDEKKKETAEEFLKTLADTFGLPDTKPEFRAMLGKTCSYPFSFIVSLKIALEALAQRDAHPKPEAFDTFAWATRANIMMCGDSCGRVALYASLLAASGVDVNVVWTKRTNQFEEVNAMGTTLLDAATGRKNTAASSEHWEDKSNAARIDALY